MINLKTHSLVAVLTLAAMLTACQNKDTVAEQAGAFADAETERLNAWLDERFEEQLQFSPINLHELDCAISEMREQSERFKSEIEPAWQKLYS